ncbi:predicted protein [Botrytis cinerea T4]|uniref:Uncharacterized protein n=1 Tax=Botryotinia fuckeliana (strain T4) TaxID=999810 RepID=G2Y2S1_BOTF4|nr:predicted protein [Botrytis cinerea T4]
MNKHHSPPTSNQHKEKFHSSQFFSLLSHPPPPLFTLPHLLPLPLNQIITQDHNLLN